MEESASESGAGSVRASPAMLVVAPVFGLRLPVSWESETSPKEIHVLGVEPGTTPRHPPSPT